MIDYTKLVKKLRDLHRDPRPASAEWLFENQVALYDAAAAIEALQAEVKRLQEKLCDWCAVCPKERRNPDDCELLGENPVMYGPSGAKMEVQDG